MSGAPGLQAEPIRFLVFGCGGRAGRVIHPGKEEALDVLREFHSDSMGHQDGVEVGSPGQIAATMLYRSYSNNKQFDLLNESACDMVFCQEDFSLDHFSKLNGLPSPARCSSESPLPIPVPPRTNFSYYQTRMLIGIVMFYNVTTIGIPNSEPWLVTLPTTMIMLQQGTAMHDWDNTSPVLQLQQ